MLKINSNLDSDDSTHTKNDRSETPEGLDSISDKGSIGWGKDYPLDAVMVRTDIRTVGEIMRRIRKDRYIMDPEYQREFLWPTDKQSKLIES